jgi:hypothetical protein
MAIAERSTRTFGTAISPEYVKSWDVNMAIREILQNLIDTKREFGVKGSARYNAKKGIAEVKDEGPGLQLKHLALGVSEKGSDCIGQFGEGLKLALLVFAREERFIEVRSRNYRLTPVIQTSEFQTETLFFEIVEDMTLIGGTTIRFECSREELDKAKLLFPTELRVQGSANSLTWIVPNLISLPGGKVYINGALATELDDMLFSYHLFGEAAKSISNRDRTIVSRGDLLAIIRDAVSEDYRIREKLPAKWFSAIFEACDRQTLFPDPDYEPPFEAEITFWNNVPGLRKAFIERYGNNAIGSDLGSHEEDLALRIGYKPIKLPRYNWQFSLKNSDIPLVSEVIKADNAIHKLVKPTGDLTNSERINLDAAVTAVSNYYREPRDLVVVEELTSIISPGASEDSAIEGYCCFQTGRMYIARCALESYERSLRVILHETVHQRTGACDISIGFQDEYDKIAAMFLRKLTEQSP